MSTVNVALNATLNAVSNEVEESLAEPTFTDKKLADKNTINKIDLTSKPCQPHPHDVLFGRGKHVNNHMGNVYFRQLVLFERSIYKQTITCAGRRHIARHVINQIRRLDPPGRFLVPDENSKTTKWFMAKDHRALMKTAQALRELNHKPMADNVVYPNDVIVIGNKLCFNPDSKYNQTLEKKRKNKSKRKSKEDHSPVPSENHFYTPEKQGKEACIDVEMSTNPEDDTRDLDREDNSDQDNTSGSIDQIDERHSNPLSLLSYICDYSSEKTSKDIVPSTQPIKATHLDISLDRSQHNPEQLSNDQFPADEDAQRFTDSAEIMQLAKSAPMAQDHKKVTEETFTLEHADRSTCPKNEDTEDPAKSMNPSNQSTNLAKDQKTNITIINNHIVRNSNSNEMEISTSQNEIPETLEQASKADKCDVKKNKTNDQDDSGSTNNQNSLQVSNHSSLGEKAVAVLMQAIQNKWSKAKLSDVLTRLTGNRVAMEKNNEGIHAPVPDANVSLVINEPVEEHQAALLSSSELNSMKIDSDSLLQNPQLTSNYYSSLVPQDQNETRNDFMNSTHVQNETQNDVPIPNTCISTGKATNGSSPENFNYIQDEKSNAVLLDDMMIEDAMKTHLNLMKADHSDKVEYNTSVADYHHTNVANEKINYRMELDSNNEFLGSIVKPVPISVVSCYHDPEDKRKVQGQQKSKDDKKNGHRKFILPISYIGQSFANHKLIGKLDLSHESKVVFEELVELKSKGEGAELHLPSVVGSLCQRIIDLEELLLV